MDQAVYWIISATVSILTITTTLLSGSFLFGSRIARLELKTDTIWDLLMKRAITDAVSKGIATVNSPIRVNTDAFDWFTAIADDLHKYYISLNTKLSDKDLALELEKKFGEKLLHDVSIRYDLSYDVCLIVAVVIARLGLAEAKKQGITTEEIAEKKEEERK